ncbi:hypothetical protein [Pedobacter jejuensis]|uniref:Lipocalin-like domain-containing protein n=1 Tax=Pedobacter jejuensis TaxID=1268550 RepID=A0A3N0BVE2_9SPHI|nr:hypothetical protein [Pedobacter jejuensis]RNL53399.1 hypothetical protein D7004_09970 [Pedobacter jejuensis]
MKIYAPLLITILFLSACNQSPKEIDKVGSKINGTWKLVSSLSITKGDTVNTSPPKNVEMIKILNDTHFAFFKHDLNKGKGTDATFDSGSGTYSLNGDNYKEHLAYCSAREWENHDFNFKVTLNQDTLTQSGIEKIENLNINREIVEVYVRVMK